MEGEQIAVDHAIEKDVLKWKTHLHLDAVGEVLQHFNRLVKLGEAVDEGDVFAGLLPALQPVRVHELEVAEGLLGLGEALGDILLEQVDLREVCLDSREKLKDDPLGLLTLEQRSEQGAS